MRRRRRIRRICGMRRIAAGAGQPHGGPRLDPRCADTSGMLRTCPQPKAGNLHVCIPRNDRRRRPPRVACTCVPPHVSGVVLRAEGGASRFRSVLGEGVDTARAAPMVASPDRPAPQPAAPTRSRSIPLRHLREMQHLVGVEVVCSSPVLDGAFARNSGGQSVDDEPAICGRLAGIRPHSLGIGGPTSVTFPLSPCHTETSAPCRSHICRRPWFARAPR